MICYLRFSRCVCPAFFFWCRHEQAQLPSQSSLKPFTSKELLSFMRPSWMEQGPYSLEVYRFMGEAGRWINHFSWFRMILVMTELPSGFTERTNISNLLLEYPERFFFYKKNLLIVTLIFIVDLIFTSSMQLKENWVLVLDLPLSSKVMN